MVFVGLMDGINFRLLLHEQSLVQVKHPDLKLLLSLDYHRHDLATTLETAKWQSSQLVINDRQILNAGRYNSGDKQFVRAVREQIIHVEKNLEDTSLRVPMRNNEWVNLNEQDRDGLALFLSGGNPNENFNRYDLEDSGMLKRFIDPTTASSSKDSASGLIEHSSREIENLNINGVTHINHNLDPRKENNLRRVTRNYTKRLKGGESKGIPQHTLTFLMVHRYVGIPNSLRAVVFGKFYYPCIGMSLQCFSDGGKYWF
ncbi:hypothetical protein CFP56_020224 [Quercus suber]|uniref:Uncharacterized protein n=1 Tax=Quercus suber TaxID=58331 RepID=A0AAW0KFL0_QUESU